MSKQQSIGKYKGILQKILVACLALTILISGLPVSAAEQKSEVNTATSEKEQAVEAASDSSAASNTISTSRVPSISNTVCNDSLRSRNWLPRANFQVGDQSHGDRDYIVIDTIPDFLVGSDWIRTPMESRSYSLPGNTVYEFDVTVATDLYIAWSVGVTPQAWLNGYEKTDNVVITRNLNNNSTTTFDLYKKAVQAGEHIAFGQQGSTSSAMYFALLDYVSPKQDTTGTFVISNLTVKDSAHSSQWSVQENLSQGDSVYGDESITYESVPTDLIGCDWIRPANVSSGWNGSLCEFAVNSSGYLYIALSADIPDALGWMTGYDKTADTISVGGKVYNLYRKQVDEGTAVELGGQNNSVSPMYIPIVKTKAISAPPDIPTISQFTAPYHTDGWYFVRENLDVGSKLYTYESKNQNRIVSVLPDEYKGCEYLQTYNGAKSALYFYVERDTEITVALDSRNGNGPTWLQAKAWKDTGKTMQATGDAGAFTYKLYTKVYQAGECVYLSAMTGSGDNFSVIFRPTDQVKGKTNNPVVPMGADLEGPSSAYTYYTSDVFNLDEDVSDSGYTVKTGSVKIVVAANESEVAKDKDEIGEGEGDGDGDEEPVKEYRDVALNKRTTSSGDFSPQYGKDYAVDDNQDTYWEASGVPSWLTVNLRGAKSVEKVVLQTRPNWGNRTQTFSIEGSLDGTEYTTLVESQEYTFVRDERNTLTIPLPEGSEAAFIRLSCTGNTGSEGRAQVSTFQVFGLNYPDEPEPPEPEPEDKNRYIRLSGNSGSGAVLEKTFEKTVSDRAIFEYKVRSSEADQPMSVSLNDEDGSEIATLTFEGDGYLTATNGNSQDNVVPYRKDTWYTVKLVVDSDRGVYDVWVNHLRKLEGLAISSKNSVGTLSFEVEQDSVGSLFVDNVYAYDDTEIYQLREDFNDLDAGTRPGEGWTFTNPAEVLMANVPFAEDKSLELSAKNSQVTAVRELPELSGTLTFETQIKPVGVGFSLMPVLADDENRVAVAVAFYHNQIYASNGDNWVKIIDGESPWCYYPANNWYKITIKLNTNTNRYDLYVDGALRMKDLSFAEDVEAISRVSFTASEGTACYIKYLDLYEGTDFGRGVYPNKIVLNIKDAPYNAVGDGVTDDTEAVQAALDDAAYSGATVLLEDGVFLTSMIRVGSDTTLFIDTSAKLLGVRDKYQYPQVTDCSGRVNAAQVGKTLIYIAKASNVRVEGGGTIDGNGFYGYGENDPSGNNRRPTIILPALSYDVTIQNVDLINSAFWTLVPMESTNMTMRNININSMNAPNRDGIDPTDLINATIENCNILAADDALCFKTSAIYGNRNIDVRNMTLQSTIASGIKLGTDTYDALENLTVEDIIIKNVNHSGIAIESVDGSEVDTLSFERIDMGDVSNPIFFVVGNRRRQPPAQPGARIGYIRNITFKDINFSNRKFTPYALQNSNPNALFLGLDTDHRIQNVRLENVNMELPGGISSVPGWPTGSGGGYPEQNNVGTSNAWGYCLRWCDNFTFVNCTNTLLAPDARNEIMYHPQYNPEPAMYDRPIRYVMPVKRLSAAVGTDVQTLLPDKAQVIVDFDQVETVSVSWSHDDYDPNRPGEYQFMGTINEANWISNPNALTATCIVSMTSDAISVSDVSLDRSTLSMIIGAEITLDATITPSDATNQKVTWSSEDETIATVDSSGKVTAVENGQTVITVTTEDGSLTAQCTVTVTTDAISVSDVSLDRSTLSMIIGAETTLDATITPSDATNQKVTWSSEDETIATVDPSGKVTAVENGQTVITVTTEDGGLTAQCTVTVGESAVLVTEITIDGETEVAVGDTATYTAVVEPENATNSVVKWSVDNEDLAVIDESSGELTAISPGTVSVTATATDGSGVTNTSLVVISEDSAVPVESITIEQGALTNLSRGKTLQLSVTIAPENATDQTITWSSSNSNILTVSEDGEVTAIKAGMVRVVATAPNGVTSTVTIRVQ